MRLARGAAAVAVLAGALVVGGASPARAESISLSPASGPPGTSFTVVAEGFLARLCIGTSILVYWDGEVPLGEGRPGVLVRIRVTVPRDASVGLHRVAVLCNGGKTSDGGGFDVTEPPPPPPTEPPPSLPPPPPPSPRPSGGSSLPPPTPTTPGTVPSTGAVPTGSPVTPSTPPSPSGAFPSGPVPVPAAPGRTGTLVFDRPSVRPGDRLRARGAGCPPDARVTLRSGDEAVGTTVADGAGGFVGEVRFPVIRPGRRTVTADCTRMLAGDIDLVVSSGTGSNAAVALVLIFFVLAGAALMRWQIRPSRD